MDLITLLLPSFELAFFIDTLDVRYKVPRIDLVDYTVTSGTTQRIHVASLFISIDISKSLTDADDSNLDLLDRLLVVL